MTIISLLKSDTRFTEQEALEQIRLLCAQLQNLHDRAPPRGAAVATLTTLLENCRTSSPHQLTLRPPSLAMVATASGSNQHAAYSSSSSTSPAVKANGGTTYTVAIVRSDKSTNTNCTTDELCQPVSNGLTRISITDECSSSSPPPPPPPPRRTTDLEVQKSIPIIIDDSMGGEKNAPLDLSSKTIESNFLNLQLQCMCTCSGVVGGGETGDISIDAMDVEVAVDAQHPLIGKCLHCSSMDKPNSHFNVQCDTNSNTKLSECAQCDGSFNSFTAHSQQDHHRNVIVETISCQSNIVSDIDDEKNNSMMNVSHSAGTFDKSNDSYRRFGVSVTESLGNDVPPTPSPTISNISSENVDENRCRIQSQDLSSVGDVVNQHKIMINDDGGGKELIDESQSIDEAKSTIVVPNSNTTSAASTITSSEEASCSSGTSVAVTTTTSAKRNKDAKLVLDLNDRSKYTKEVSV